MSSYTIERPKTNDAFVHPFYVLETIGAEAKASRDDEWFKNANVNTAHERSNGIFTLNINQGGIRNQFFYAGRDDKATFKVEVLPGLAKEHPKLIELFPNFLNFTGNVNLHFHNDRLRRAEFTSKN